jgi:uncharacterized protein YdcH (DUF465 family)
MEQMVERLQVLKDLHARMDQHIKLLERYPDCWAELKTAKKEKLNLKQEISKLERSMAVKA